MNEKGTPAKQVRMGVPSTFRGFTAAAMLTSFAVQVLPPRCFAMVGSTSARQVPAAYAGVGRKAATAITSSAKINENFLQQFVRQFIFPPQKLVSARFEVRVISRLLGAAWARALRSVESSRYSRREGWDIANVLLGTAPSPAEGDEEVRTGKSSDAKWHSSVRVASDRNLQISS